MCFISQSGATRSHFKRGLRERVTLGIRSHPTTTLQGPGEYSAIVTRLEIGTKTVTGRGMISCRPPPKFKQQGPRSSVMKNEACCCGFLKQLLGFPCCPPAAQNSVICLLSYPLKYLGICLFLDVPIISRGTDSLLSTYKNTAGPLFTISTFC